MSPSNDNRNKVISATLTALIMAAVVVICLAFGYMPPDPPIPESGVEVNLGNSDFGLGNNENLNEGSQAASAPAAPAPAAEETATQNTEESVSMPSKPTPKPTPVKETPQEQPKAEEKPKEPVINNNALFKKKGASASSSDGGSEGNTSGEGNMGKENGNPNATGYSGIGGNGGRGGIGFSLVGRSAKSLPEPSYASNAQGKIVISVYVDRQGNVVAAENSRGTTINDQQLVNRCLDAARNAKFSASATAAEKQKGTITYVFSRAN